MLKILSTHAKKKKNSMSKKNCCGTHTTFSYFALQWKKILLPALHSYLNFTMYTFQLNELSAFVFTVHIFSAEFSYFASVWVQSSNFNQQTNHTASQV